MIQLSTNLLCVHLRCTHSTSGMVVHVVFITGAGGRWLRDQRVQEMDFKARWGGGMSPFFVLH